MGCEKHNNEWNRVYAANLAMQCTNSVFEILLRTIRP